MTIHADLAAAVLAGGRSRRFGGCKARALLGDTELIDRSLAIAAQLAADPFIVHSTDEIFDDKGVPALVDAVAGLGPIGGILTALADIDRPWLATIPCDMPLLQRSVYDTLYQHKSPGRPIAAVSAAGVEPLVALWPRAVLGRIEAHAARGDLSLHGLLQALDGVQVHFAAAGGKAQPTLFFNVNTPTDLARLEKGES